MPISRRMLEPGFSSERCKPILVRKAMRQGIIRDGENEGTIDLTKTRKGYLLKGAAARVTRGRAKFKK